jgi:hypothetical protein
MFSCLIVRHVYMYPTLILACVCLRFSETVDSRTPSFNVEVKVTVRLTVSQSVCRGVEPTLGLVTRYYFVSEGCYLVGHLL